MKTYKFRAFYKPDLDTPDGALKFEQKIINDELWFVYDDDIRYEFQIPFLDDNWVVQQYTGMVDINGIELYEGDIVEWGMSHDMINPFPRLRVIEFYLPQLIYKVVEVGDLPSSVDYLYEASPKSTRWCKVIGNIFENPELLNTSVSSSHD